MLGSKKAPGIFQCQGLSSILSGSRLNTPSRAMPCTIGRGRKWNVFRSEFLPNGQSPHLPACLSPLHPPQNATSFTIPSSTFSSMLLLHVPCVLYVYVIILRLLPVSCQYKPSVHHQTLRDALSFCRWFRVARESHPSYRSGYR